MRSLTSNSNSGQANGNMITTEDGAGIATLDGAQDSGGIVMYGYELVLTKKKKRNK